MIDNHDFFRKLNITSGAIDQIRNKIQNAKESNWIDYLEQSILLLKLDDLIADTKIVKLIKDIGDSNRIGVYRSIPNSCYGWHMDSGRQSSINMLIDGFDSMCIFGNLNPGKKYTELSVIKHEPATYYLMNVKKFHTVYNFNNQRYILSLGIPDKSFAEVKEYLKENNML
jgi:hypothetical protein